MKEVVLASYSCQYFWTSLEGLDLTQGPELTSLHNHSLDELRY